MVRVLSLALLLALAACAPAAQPAPASAPAAKPAETKPAAEAKPAGPAQPAAKPAAPAQPAKPASSTTVRVGYVPIMNFAPLYVALEKGYFREQGIDAQLTTLAGGADMLIQTAGGHFDVGAGGVGSALFNAIQRGVAVRVVAPLHAESKPMSTPLVGRKASRDAGTVKAIADLRGKKAAINARGAATEYWLDAALRQGGLTINDIDLQAIPFGDMPAALEKGVIEASMLAEPLTTLAERRGIVVRLSDDFLKDAQPTAVYYNLDFARKNPDAAKGFMVAYLKACRDLQAEGWRDAQNVAIIEKHTKVPADIIRAAAAPLFEPNGRINLSDWEKQQQFFMRQGLLTYKEPLDVRQLVDGSFVEQALRVLGSYQGRS
ncbi:MAG: ABC transporter substrate-binding protein [Chloroflexi bacterium]|nr:ABC transporter substrate-binding protein [Chloroflexota bacterium]